MQQPLAFQQGRELNGSRLTSGEGVAVNSSSESSEVSIDGLGKEEAQQHMLAWLQTTGCGQEQVNYKLRDWLFARQRYWGEPFPIIFPEGSQVYPLTTCWCPHSCLSTCHQARGCTYLYAASLHAHSQFKPSCLVFIEPKAAVFALHLLACGIPSLHCVLPLSGMRISLFTHKSFIRA